MNQTTATPGLRGGMVPPAGDMPGKRSKSMTSLDRVHLPSTLERPHARPSPRSATSERRRWSFFLTLEETAMTERTRAPGAAPTSFDRTMTTRIETTPRYPSSEGSTLRARLIAAGLLTPSRDVPTSDPPPAPPPRPRPKPRSGGF